VTSAKCGVKQGVDIFGSSASPSLLKKLKLNY